MRLGFSRRSSAVRMPGKRKPPRSRWFAWWYVSIGAGFALLGIHRLLIGERFSMVILRWLVAFGFFALGYLQFRYGSLRR
jgi:hypothetical protein